MIFKDKTGRVIDISIYGARDDIQIDSAVYEDTGEDVPDEVIDYLYDHYSDALYELCEENAIADAEFQWECSQDR